MAQQVVRRSALIDATTIKITAVIDMPEVRQRVSQRHHAAEVGDVFIRDFLALSAAAEGVGELDAIRNVINQKPCVKICRQQMLHEPLTQQDRRHIVAVHERRTRFDPSVMGRMATENHRPGSPHLATQIGQHPETADLPWQVVMKVGQQMTDEVQIRKVR